jgi:hypothetical protein
MRLFFFITALQTNQPQFYEMITATLTPDQCKLIQNFITTANRRLAEKGNFFFYNDKIIYLFFYFN